MAGRAGEREGVVKYRIDHRPGPPSAAAELALLDGWRTILHRLALVGQRPDRYEGYGYGNVSVRHDADGPQAFLVSGTQTGRPERLGAAGYARVLSADVVGNRLTSTGPVRPSSEALTHAACYAVDPAVRCVLHVHGPELWRAAGALGLATTDRAVPYGTPAMAAAVAGALRGSGGLALPVVVVMGGHEDGVLAVGGDPDCAGAALLAALARAQRVAGSTAG